MCSWDRLDSSWILGTRRPTLEFSRERKRVGCNDALGAPVSHARRSLLRDSNGRLGYHDRCRPAFDLMQACDGRTRATRIPAVTDVRLQGIPPTRDEPQELMAWPVA